MIGMCSLNTGHRSMQAPHVVQAQTASAPTTSIRLPVPSPDAAPRTITFTPWIRSFGDSTCPAANAGQARSQRPHSAQETPLYSSRQVNSSRRAAPSEDGGMPPGPREAAKTPKGDASRCMCFEYGRKARKPRTVTMWIHHIATKSDSAVDDESLPSQAPTTSPTGLPDAGPGSAAAFAPSPTR